MHLNISVFNISFTTTVIDLYLYHTLNLITYNSIILAENCEYLIDIQQNRFKLNCSYRKYCSVGVHQ